MKREEIQEQYKWDIEEISEKYPLQETIENIRKHSDQLVLLNGCFSNDEKILEALKLSDKIYLMVDNIMTYCSLKLNEDNRIAKSQTDQQTAVQAYTYYIEKSAFIDPQILALGEQLGSPPSVWPVSAPGAEG